MIKPHRSSLVLYPFSTDWLLSTSLAEPAEQEQYTNLPASPGVPTAPAAHGTIPHHWLDDLHDLKPSQPAQLAPISQHHQVSLNPFCTAQQPERSHSLPSPRPASKIPLPQHTRQRPCRLDDRTQLGNKDSNTLCSGMFWGSSPAAAEGPVRTKSIPSDAGGMEVPCGRWLSMLGSRLWDSTSRSMEVPKNVQGRDQAYSEAPLSAQPCAKVQRTSENCSPDSARLAHQQPTSSPPTAHQQKGPLRKSRSVPLPATICRASDSRGFTSVTFMVPSGAAGSFVQAVQGMYQARRLASEASPGICAGPSQADQSGKQCYSDDAISDSAHRCSDERSVKLYQDPLHPGDELPMVASVTPWASGAQPSFAAETSGSCLHTSPFSLSAFSQSLQEVLQRPVQQEQSKHAVPQLRAHTSCGLALPCPSPFAAAQQHELKAVMESSLRQQTIGSNHLLAEHCLDSGPATGRCTRRISSPQLHPSVSLCNLENHQIMSKPLEDMLEEELDAELLLQAEEAGS